MLQWFRSDPVSALLYILAVPSTVILILQTILLLFGAGQDEAEFDSDIDTDIDSDIDGDNGEMQGDTGLRLLTVRGIVAFFSVGGWSGIAALQLGAAKWVAIIIALIMGGAALLIVAAFFKWIVKLQANGTLEIKNAVGCTGEVYMTIPANGGGNGKVNVVIQERLAEVEAVTNADRDIKYGEKVRVVDVIGQGTLVVEPLA